MLQPNGVTRREDVAVMIEVPDDVNRKHCETPPHEDALLVVRWERSGRTPRITKVVECRSVDEVLTQAFVMAGHDVMVSFEPPAFFRLEQFRILELQSGGKPAIG